MTRPLLLPDGFSLWWWVLVVLLMVQLRARVVRACRS